jgi:hypothetical protein
LVENKALYNQPRIFGTFALPEVEILLPSCSKAVCDYHLALAWENQLEITYTEAC